MREMEEKKIHMFEQVEEWVEKKFTLIKNLNLT